MNEPKNLIMKCVAGSHLYGLNTPSSDMDTRGIYLEDIDDVLNINGRQNGECADDKQDEKYYSLGKFLKLASE
jgi:predicted nucleotidyltransferase